MILQVQKLLDELVRIRKARGISQAELARILNVHYSTVNHFEHGSRESPRITTLFRYAAALGVNLKLEIDYGNEVQLRDTNRPRESAEGAPGI